MKTYRFIDYLNRIKRRLWSTDTIDLYVRDPNQPLPLQWPCQGDFRTVDSDNVTDSQTFEDSKYTEVYTQMLRDGQYGLYGYINGICAFRGWVQLHGSVMFHNQAVIDLGSEDAYLHYFFTSPEKRGNGLQSKGIELLVGRFAEKKLYTLIKADNKTSINNFCRNGFSKISRISIQYRFGHAKITTETLIP